MYEFIPRYGSTWPYYRYSITVPECSWVSAISKILEIKVSWQYKQLHRTRIFLKIVKNVCVHFCFFVRKKSIPKVQY